MIKACALWYYIFIGSQLTRSFDDAKKIQWGWDFYCVYFRVSSVRFTHSCKSTLCSIPFESKLLTFLPRKPKMSYLKYLACPLTLCSTFILMISTSSYMRIRSETTINAFKLLFSVLSSYFPNHQNFHWRHQSSLFCFFLSKQLWTDTCGNFTETSEKIWHMTVYNI